VNALSRIHAALVPGGLVIDTQPVSAQPPIEADAGDLGPLDMREWARTIATIDSELDRAIGDGLFALEAERRFVVTDGYNDGAEFVAEVREWAGTHIEDAFAARLAKEPGRIRLHQEVRLRVLRAL
jgi:hypothetical protein